MNYIISTCDSFYDLKNQCKWEEEKVKVKDKEIEEKLN